VGTPKRLGEFEQLLLFALLHLGEDAHGTSIRRLILERTGREVSPGALYTAMDRLEVQGLVSSHLGNATPERGGRRRRHYLLVPEGRDALQEAWATVSSMAEGVEPQLRPEEGA
jgi:DNA-binding PadR family transcriptional regulator